MSTGTCYLLNAPENIKAALQLPLASSASENTPKAMKRYNSYWHFNMHPAGVPLVWWAGASENVPYCTCHTLACSRTYSADWLSPIGLIRMLQQDQQLSLFRSLLLPPQIVLLEIVFQSFLTSLRKREALFRLTGYETQIWTGERVQMDISLSSKAGSLQSKQSTSALPRYDAHTVGVVTVFYCF